MQTEATTADAVAALRRVAREETPPHRERSHTASFAAYIPALHELRAAGFHWPEIAERLARFGITAPDGKPLKPETLRKRALRSGYRSADRGRAYGEPAGATTADRPDDAAEDSGSAAHEDLPPVVSAARTEQPHPTGQAPTAPEPARTPPTQRIGGSGACRSDRPDTGYSIWDLVAKRDDFKDQEGETSW